MDSDSESELSEYYEQQEQIKRDIQNDDYFYNVQEYKLYLEDKSREFSFLKNFSTQTLIDNFMNYRFKTFPKAAYHVPQNIIDIMDRLVYIICDRDHFFFTQTDLINMYNQLKYIDDYKVRTYKSYKNVKAPPIPPKM